MRIFFGSARLADFDDIKERLRWARPSRSGGADAEDEVVRQRTAKLIADKEITPDEVSGGALRTRLKIHGEHVEVPQSPESRFLRLPCLYPDGRFFLGFAPECVGGAQLARHQCLPLRRQNDVTRFDHTDRRAPVGADLLGPETDGTEIGQSAQAQPMSRRYISIAEAAEYLQEFAFQRVHRPHPVGLSRPFAVPPVELDRDHRTAKDHISPSRPDVDGPQEEP